MGAVKNANADLIEAQAYDFSLDDEANAFAMELLMPFDWVVRDAGKLDLCDEAGIARLAKRYKVPAPVMAIRIGEVRRELEAQPHD